MKPNWSSEEELSTQQQRTNEGMEVITTTQATESKDTEPSLGLPVSEIYRQLKKNLLLRLKGSIVCCVVFVRVCRRLRRSPS